MEGHNVVKIAQYRLLAYRLFMRLFIGKKKRDQLIIKNKITYLDFLPLFFGNRIVKSNEGFKAVPRSKTHDFYLLFLSRENEIKEHLKMNSGEIFVDVGANVGYYSLLLAKNNPDIKIISIEAHPENFKAMNKNIKINNFQNIIAINKAVSNQSGGKIRLYEYFDENGRKFTGMFDNSNRYNAKSFREIDCDSLDNILSTNKIVYVIKIDIEGEESNALLGATNTLKYTRKIIVEIHNDENLQKVKQILLSNQFNIEIIKGTMTYLIGTKNVISTRQ